MSDDDLGALFCAIPNNEPIAVAVSGGGDSMALLVLVHRWALSHNVRLLALTVDHNLRAESADEASFVAQFCAARGIEHRSLLWENHSETGNLSDQARSARYDLMIAEAARANVNILLTGHTLDDQAETVLMRLGRGSGVDGLAGMPKQTARHGCRLMRPFLDVSRADLRMFLKQEGITWVDDPTNDNPDYMRIKARQALPVLEPLGITPQRLIRTSEMMALAEDVLSAAADDLAAVACQWFDLGYVTIIPSTLCTARRETGLRLLARVLRRVSGQVYRPRLEALSALLDAIARPDYRGGTLHGCLIRPHDTENILICRELSACPAPQVPTSTQMIWDNRYRLSFCDELPQDVHIAPLGEAGLKVLAADAFDMPEPWKTAPRIVRLAVPALWQKGTLLAVPHADFLQKGVKKMCDRVAPVTNCVSQVDTG